ncbi:hypothetical protein DXG01_002351 [Tephrocybe rancida]|nr:hypothetical protein DXG01_002351 [Tephrocybe rancida]
MIDMTTEVYPYGFPDYFSSEEAASLKSILAELQELKTRILREQEVWVGCDGYDELRYATAEQWVKETVKSGDTERTAEELNTQAKRGAEFEEEFQEIMLRLKAVLKVVNLRAQLLQAAGDVILAGRECNIGD